jgi:hypothetical protein
MTGNFLLLAVLQIFFLTVYRWVGKRYIFASRVDHPAIFWSQSITPNPGDVLNSDKALS